MPKKPTTSIIIPLVATLAIFAVLFAIGLPSLASAGSAPTGPTCGTSTSTTCKSTYWHMPFTVFYSNTSVVTNSRPLYIDTPVVLPNGLRLQVERIERNWQPSAADLQTWGLTQSGDDPRGKEIVLIWFRATDVGAADVLYNPNYFTLAVQGSPEERVAALSEMPPASYGSQGKAPWLRPGDSMETFEPFLVTPNAVLQSFQYYIFPFPGSLTLPQRCSITLQPGPVSSAAAGNAVVTFNADQTITVGP